MKKLLLSFFMCMLAIIGMQAEEVTDVLKADDFAATSTTYTEFSGVKKTSDAVYAGQSAKNSGNIQLRTTNSNSGIVSTTSGGNVKSVTITVLSSDRQIDVYGSNTAYTSAANLYATLGNTNQGDLLGSLTETGTITVTGDYKYVGIRSKSGAITLSQVEITWEVTGEVIPQQLAAPTFSPAGGAVEAGTLVAISATNDATIMYKVGDAEYDVYSAPIEVTEECTITAYATKDGYEPSDEATATYTIEPPFEPTVFGKVVDVLNLAFTGVSGTYYDGWADKVGKSGTKYLGNSAGGNDAIQLRSSGSGSNSGIVTDRSVGTVKKVTVKWNSNTESGRTLDVYGKSTAYGTAEELYDNSTRGSKLGSIVCGTSTELEIDGNYEYIGLRSKSGTMYLDEIQIEWYVPYPENITADTYVLLPGTFETENCELYAVRFVNKNDDSEYKMQGYLNEHVVYFDYKGAENYTHMTFYVIENNKEYATPDNQYPDIKTANVLNFEKWEDFVIIEESKETTYKGEFFVYNLLIDDWAEVDPEVATGLNRVELAAGIGYDYGVVSAEGAIEVYNVNGAVVARGNDTIDLRGLGRGVYIIRNGNQVRKVVR